MQSDYFFVVITPTLASFFFFFNDTATTEIYTLSLHDALPICVCLFAFPGVGALAVLGLIGAYALGIGVLWLLLAFRLRRRSEEHTSELQSQSNLVCRLLLEKKKKTDCRRHSPWRGPPSSARSS